MTKSIKYSVVITGQFYKMLEDGSPGQVLHAPLRAKIRILDPSKFQYLVGHIDSILEELEKRSLEMTTSASAWILKALLDLRCEITITNPSCTIK